MSEVGRDPVHRARYSFHPDGENMVVDCWIEVTNAGGAAGFPFPPIDASTAAPAVDTLVEGLAPETSRLVIASVDGELAGWLNVRRESFPLVAHWGTLHHVQTRTGLRGRGIGAALMRHVREIARDGMGKQITARRDLEIPAGRGRPRETWGTAGSCTRPSGRPQAKSFTRRSGPEG